MGKAGRNEMKRVGAGFLNAAAVAMLTTGGLTPLLKQDQGLWIPVVAAIVSAAMHSLALVIARTVEE